VSGGSQVFSHLLALPLSLSSVLCLRSPLSLSRVPARVSLALKPRERGSIFLSPAVAGQQVYIQMVELVKVTEIPVEHPAQAHEVQGASAAAGAGDMSHDG
jgi:hypothetical protein